MLNSPEDVMLDEERVPGWLEYEVLHEGLRRVFVSLQQQKKHYYFGEN